MPINRWMDKQLRYIHTIKKEKPRCTTGMNPKDCTKQKKWSQKRTYSVIHLSKILEFSDMDDLAPLEFGGGDSKYLGTFLVCHKLVYATGMW